MGLATKLGVYRLMYAKTYLPIHTLGIIPDFASVSQESFSFGQIINLNGAVVRIGIGNEAEINQD